MLANEVHDGSGNVIGFRCCSCDKVKTKMWGKICNSCRKRQGEHDELIAALRDLMRHAVMYPDAEREEEFNNAVRRANKFIKQGNEQ